MMIRMKIKIQIIKKMMRLYLRKIITLTIINQKSNTQKQAHRQMQRMMLRQATLLDATEQAQAALLQVAGGALPLDS